MTQLTLLDARLCAVCGVANQYYAKGLCKIHYDRHRRRGRADLPRLRQPPSDPDATRKMCAKCREWKPVEQFRLNQRRRDGRYPYCRPCDNKSTREWNEVHRERRREIANAWRRRNLASGRLNQNRRRARILSRSFDVSRRDIDRLIARSDGRCAYCGNPWEHLDHVVPIARGGTHGIGNLLPACAKCNQSKNRRLLVEWRYKRQHNEEGEP